MKKYIPILALVMTTISATVNAKTLVLFSKPEDQSTTVATVQSGDRLIPIFTPAKSEWIKVANPKNGHVGWLKRQDLGLNEAPKIYQKRFERESGDKKKSPYRHEVYEYRGSEKLTEDQVKRLFERMERQKVKIHHDMWSVFNKMMDEVSNLDRTTPDFSQAHEPFHYIVVPDDTFSAQEAEKNSTTKNNI